MLIENKRGALPRSLIAGVAMFALLSTQVLCPGFAQEPPPPAAKPPSNPVPSEPGPAPGHATQKQLEQLVSPIALYPDLLVAQILAASTYPTQIVEADRWLHDNPNLKGKQLTDAASQQPWDPSVKSLTQYAPVLDNMSKNLSWTSALGQAYYNQPADVMNAIQTLRHMAQKAGTLKTTPQQKVVVENAAGTTSAAPTTTVTEGTSGNTTIIIEPAQPQIVYVPEYNPTTAYGQPMPPPPGYSSEDLLMTGLLGFGLGMLIGDMIGSSNNSWGCNWHGGNVVYNHNVYISNSNLIPSRWGYHPFAPNHPYYGYGPGHYGYNDYPRPYTEPTMPKQYDQPQYRPEQSAMNHPDDQRSWQNSRNSTPNGGYRSPADENFRGYGDQEHQANRTWGGNPQPGGFAQAASSRGRDSYNGTNARWGNGRLPTVRRF